MKTVPGTILLLSAAVLAACGGGTDEAPTASVYKSFGSVQCTGGGQSLATLRQQLVDLGVGVAAATCGNDGLAHAAVCGGGDGRIAIMDINAGQVQIAASAGFAPLANLPSAVRTACP